MSDAQTKWEAAANADPFYAVLSEDRFRSGVIDDRALRAFFKTGKADVDIIVSALRHLGARFPAARALDFGCGVGRLALPMRRYTRELVGVDIAPRMLDLAKQHAAAAGLPDLRFVPQAPICEFDWIASCMVFQHIPSSEGMSVLRAILDLAASRCRLSLHFCFGEPLDRPCGDSGPLAMHAYSVTAVLREILARGFEDPMIRITNHAGYIGGWIIGTRGFHRRRSLVARAQRRSKLAAAVRWSSQITRRMKESVMAGERIVCELPKPAF